MTTLSARIPSSEMLHRVALVRTDVSEEHIVAIITVKRLIQLGMLAVTLVLVRWLISQ
jgi:hypothetical protein